MNDKLEAGISAREKNVTQMDLLIFAKWILAIIAVIFVAGCATEIMWNGNMVFEICKTTLPTFAGMIMGYYFGKN